MKIEIIGNTYIELATEINKLNDGDIAIIMSPNDRLVDIDFSYFVRKLKDPMIGFIFTDVEVNGGIEYFSGLELVDVPFVLRKMGNLQMAEGIPDNQARINIMHAYLKAGLFYEHIPEPYFKIKS